MMSWEDVTGSNPNLSRFLDFLGKAEGADWGTIVGGRTFSDFSRHPNVVGLRTKEGPSTAAGRYQITGTTYNDVAPKLGITDFSPESQNRIAIELIRRKGALDDVLSGNYEGAIRKLGSTWASLPTSPYSQPKRDWNFVNANLRSSGGNDGWETITPRQQTSNDSGWEDVAPAAPAAPAPSPRPAPAPTAAPAPVAAAPVVQAPAKPLTDDQLNSDPTWVGNARRLYRETSGNDFKGSDADAAKWLKNYVAQTKYNFAGAGTTVLDAVNKLSPDGKKALLDSIKVYGEGPTSLESVGRFLKAQATDPVNYATMGVGGAAMKLLGRKALQEGTELAIRKALEKSLVTKALQSTGTKAAATGAIFGAAGDAADQAVQIAADGQDGYNVKQGAVAAGTGAVVGKAADAVVNRLTGRTAVTKFAKGSDSPEGLRIKAEVSKDFENVASNPNLRAVDADGNPTIATALRNQQASRYIDDVTSAIKRVEPGLLKKYDVETALKADRIITPEELLRIRAEGPNGNILADGIEKYQRAMSLTAPQPASGSMGAKLTRAGIELAPKIAAATAGASTFGPAGLFAALLTPRTSPGWAQRLTGKATTPEVIESLSSPKNVKAAGKVLDILGPSKAQVGREDIAVLARAAERDAAAKAQVAAQEKAAQAAAKATQQQAVKEAADAAKTLREANSTLGISPQGRIVDKNMKVTGGIRGNLQVFSGLDDKEVVKGLKQIKAEEPYLGSYIDRILKNDNVPSRDMVLALTDRLDFLKSQGVLKAAEAPPGALGQATKMFDAKGKEILSKPAYDTAAKATQDSYARTIDRVQKDTALSADSRQTVVNALEQLSTSSPREADAVMKELGKTLSTLPKGDFEKASELLLPLVQKFLKNRPE